MFGGTCSGKGGAVNVTRGNPVWLVMGWCWRGQHLCPQACPSDGHHHPGAQRRTLTLREVKSLSQVAQLPKKADLSFPS